MIARQSRQEQASYDLLIYHACGYLQQDQCDILFVMATEGLGVLLCTWPVSFRMCSRWGSFAWLELVSTLQGGILHLTHWGRVTHIYVSKLAWPTPSHYLNQCWNFDNCTLGNKLQWNLNRNVYIFIQENAFANVVWKMAAILSRPQCVNFQHRHVLPKSHWTKQNGVSNNSRHLRIMSAKWSIMTTKWTHFPRYWPFFAGHSPVNSPHKDPGALMFSWSAPE